MVIEGKILISDIREYHTYGRWREHIVFFFNSFNFREHREHLARIPQTDKNPLYKELVRRINDSEMPCVAEVKLTATQSSDKHNLQTEFEVAEFKKFCDDEEEDLL